MDGVPTGRRIRGLGLSYMQTMDNELISAGGLNTVGKKAKDIKLNVIIDVKVVYADVNGNIFVQ